MKTVSLRIIALVLAALAGGCATPPPPDLPQSLQREAEQILHAGDVLKIAFPGAPNLDSTQQIRRDGKLNLPMVGEVVAADRTPADLQTELRGAYSKQLLSGDVTVTVVSSPFTVFVAGAVLRPGKIAPERAITALEAVMEAGGIRNERDTIRRVTLDLQALLDGRQSTPFYLKAYDIVYVPEKFSFF